MNEVKEIGCHSVREHLTEFLHGEMDEAVKTFIEDHLRACPACRSRVEFEIALLMRIRQLSTTRASLELRDRVTQLIASHR